MREWIKNREMRIRSKMPPWIRTIFRLVQSSKPMELSKTVPEKLLRECRFCSSRIALLNYLPHAAVVAELGTFKGDFAQQILARCNPRELHLVDIDYSQFDEKVQKDDRVIRHCGLTHEVISGFPDLYFDWIYVDADHSYDGTLRDARFAMQKLKSGGYLVFNDFAHIDPYLGRYGVHRAVTDFALENQWPFYYFAFNEAALYDVALQKPTATAEKSDTSQDTAILVQ